MRETSPSEPQLDTGALRLLLKWESNFQPAEIKEVVQEEPRRHRYRLIDANEKSATLIGGALKPVIENGKLVIEVPVQDRDSPDYFGAVTGLVFDDKDRPLSGVRVGLVATHDRVSSELRHQSTTDAEGRYRLRDIPAAVSAAAPWRFRLSWRKQAMRDSFRRRSHLKGARRDRFRFSIPFD